MRECGPCQTCCTVAEVVEGNVDKPAWQTCAHQCEAGCSIFGELTRPKVCSSFQCAWLRGVGKEGHRPDRIGAMFSVNRTGNGHIGFAIETVEGALRTTAKRMAISFVKETNLPLVVVSFGKLPPNDTGDLLVLRKEHVLRAISMRGPFVEKLSPEVSLYEFARRAG